MATELRLVSATVVFLELRKWYSNTFLRTMYCKITFLTEVTSLASVSHYMGGTTVNQEGYESQDNPPLPVDLN